MECQHYSSEHGVKVGGVLSQDARAIFYELDKKSADEIRKKSHLEGRNTLLVCRHCSVRNAEISASGGHTNVRQKYNLNNQRIDS